MPRWAEDPTPVFAAIAGYLRVTDPEQAADRRFARAAAEATAKIDELVRRAARTRPVRARCVGFLLRRSRAIAGLRELPKFAWLYAFARMREQLLAAGAELRQRGVLERAEDVMFLDFRGPLTPPRPRTASTCAHLITTRRAEYERELGRRSVPGLLLSDGTVPRRWRRRCRPSLAHAGMAAAAGTATGRARVVLDPTDARVEPGEILVAPDHGPRLDAAVPHRGRAGDRDRIPDRPRTHRGPRVRHPGRHLRPRRHLPDHHRPGDQHRRGGGHRRPA